MQKIREGDLVEVITGDEKGRRGNVRALLLDEQRLILTEVNIVKRHTKPRPPARQGGIIEQEAPIHISNVALVCKSCDQPVRVGFKVAEDGSKVRVCRRCGEALS